MGGSNLEFANDVLGFDNSIFILASSSSPISGNKTSTQIGASDFWLVKVSEFGDFIWDKTYGGVSTDDPLLLIKLSEERLMLAGGTSSSASYDVVGVNNGNRDCWFFTVDKNGNLIEQKNIGGNQFDMIKSIVNQQDGNLLLFGESQSGISGDKTSVSYGARDFWLVEISTTMKIEDNTLLNSYNLFPNPNNGNFTISGLENNSKVIIYNIQGQVIKEFNTSTEKQIIYNHLNKNIESGIYIVSIENSQKITLIKYIVN